MYLNCHSYYSFGYGTLSPERILQQAARFGIGKLVLSDINNTSGCWEIYRLGKKYGIETVFGIEFRNGPRLMYTGIAMNNDGFEELNRHLSLHKASGKPFPERAPAFAQVHIVYPFRKEQVFPLQAHEYIGVQPADLNRYRLSAWQKFPGRMLAWMPVSFITRRDFNAHRLLRAMDLNTLYNHIPPDECGSETDIMLPPDIAAERFRDFPELCIHAQQLLETCTIQETFHQSKNKKFFSDSLPNDIERLKQLAREGAQWRYGNHSADIQARIDKELNIIVQKDFVSYFLINHDIVRYARERSFFYVGRGSGANSIIAYCLGITNVDPVELDLYFERFINLYRESPPDFDIDFSWRDRDEIISYIFQKYGTEHVCQLATFSTIQKKSAIRELSKVFGLPKRETEELIRNYDKKAPEHEAGRHIYTYTQFLADFPAHLSIHAGGILISEAPIYRYTATDMPPKGNPISQFDMHSAEDLGLYKFDILSQRGLGHIKDTLHYVKERHNLDIDIHHTAPFKTDEQIKELLRTGATMGCFYVESPGMRMLLRKMECQTYPELVAASSIIRPGVARSGMMREYVFRHRNPAAREHIHPVLQQIMPDTYGVMVYQEDVIKVAHYFAGLSLAESDVLRRGMSGKYRSREEFKQVEEAFFTHCRRLERDPETTLMVWRQIESFAGFSFAKGHSASFAVESYQSLYLKSRFPLEFYTAVVNNFGGFYQTAFYLHQAKLHGADLQLPCINRGEYLSALKNTNELFIGFIHIRFLEQGFIEQVLTERQRHGPFHSLDELVERLRAAFVSVSPEQLLILVRTGALRSFGIPAHELMWQAHMLLQKKPQAHAAASGNLFPKPGARHFSLPRPDTGLQDQVLEELDLLGFPVSLSYFEILSPKPSGYCMARDIPALLGKKIRLLGWLVTTKTAYTIKNEAMYFGTFLDEESNWIDTVHFPESRSRYPFSGEGCYLLEGTVSEEFGFYTVEVSYMEKCRIYSRD